MINKKNIEHKMKKNSNKVEQVLVIFFCVCLILLTIFTLHKETVKEITLITGDAISRVNVSAPPNVPCNIEFQEGLNLVSFFCIVFETPKAEIVENITNLVSIFEYQEGNSDKWKSYNPSLPPQIIQDLNTMSRTEGYWVRVSADETFTHDGGLRTPTNLHLISGWNLAGYPTNRTKNVTESFASITGNYSEVRAFNANTQSFLSHIPPASGGLSQTTSGSGYWINTTVTEIWVVGE